MPIEKAIQKLSTLRYEAKDDLKEIQAEMIARFGEHFERHETFRELPAPEELQMSLSRCFAERHSERLFRTDPLSDQVLANILYAADARNPNGHKTTPSALDWQDTEIYVLTAEGIFRWVSDRRGLVFCAPDDIRALTCYAQPTVVRAPLQLVYVSNRAKTRGRFIQLAEKIFTAFKNEVWNEERIDEMRSRATHINVGVKIEAVYLAAAAMDLACVSRTGFPPERLAKALHLKDDEVVVACQSLGYRPKGLLDRIR